MLYRMNGVGWIGVVCLFVNGSVMERWGCEVVVLWCEFVCEFCYVFVLVVCDVEFVCVWLVVVVCIGECGCVVWCVVGDFVYVDEVVVCIWYVYDYYFVM